MTAVLSLLLLLTPLKYETGKFTIYVDGKKIGTEEFTIAPQPRGYTVEGHTIITDASQTVDLKSKMELDPDLKTKAYEFQSQGGTIKLTVGSPLSELETNAKGNQQHEDIRFPADAFILDTNFFHHYAILLYRIRAAMGTSTVAAFVPQDLKMGGMTIRKTGVNAYEMETDGAKILATTDDSGKLIRLNFPDSKVVVER